MKKIVFAGPWREFFAEFGLVSFDDFLRYSAGERINKNNRREVITFALGRGSQKKRFFLKRFLNPHFKDMLFTWRNFGQLCSQARCEWENAKLLFDNGVETYKPVCYGEQMRWALERKSFIVTEELQAQPLTDFVAQKWQYLRTEQKDKIIADLATFVRGIHDLNISLPDLYIWHIFIKEGERPNEYDFAVIDLHRMARNVTDQNHKTRNLGRLDHSMLDKYFDHKLRRLFIESYAGRDWPGDVAGLSSKVKKRSNAISSRRKQKEY